MLEFREITIGDKPFVDKALAASDFRGCEYSFGNNLAWRRGANSKIAFLHGFYICAATSPSFSCVNPAGEGDRTGLINELRRYALSQGTPLRITGVTADQIPFFEEQFPGAYTVETNPDYFDYVYNVTDFRDFAGKRYHSKRNHLSRFKTLNNYTYNPITEADFDECIAFAAKQFDDKQDNGDGTAADVSFGDGSALIEQFAINTFFNYYSDLGLRGGIIRIDGQIAAFTVGERLNSDTYDVHIEKADTSFHGAYTAIANGFAADLAPLTNYLNREEDLGIEGLRRSKQSYYPVFLIEKSSLTFRD
jgi:hypothetical protein